MRNKRKIFIFFFFIIIYKKKNLFLELEMYKNTEIKL